MVKVTKHKRDPNKTVRIPSYFQKSNSASLSLLIKAGSYRKVIKDLRKNNKCLATELQKARTTMSSQQDVLKDYVRDSNRMMYAHSKLKDIAVGIQRVVIDLDAVMEFLDVNTSLKHLKYISDYGSIESDNRMKIVNPTVSSIEEVSLSDADVSNKNVNKSVEKESTPTLEDNFRRQSRSFQAPTRETLSTEGEDNLRRQSRSLQAPTRGTLSTEGMFDVVGPCNDGTTATGSHQSLTPELNLEPYFVNNKTSSGASPFSLKNTKHLNVEESDCWNVFPSQKEGKITDNLELTESSRSTKSTDTVSSTPNLQIEMLCMEPTEKQIVGKTSCKNKKAKRDNCVIDKQPGKRGLSTFNDPMLSNKHVDTKNETVSNVAPSVVSVEPAATGSKNETILMCEDMELTDVIPTCLTGSVSSKNMTLEDHEKKKLISNKNIAVALMSLKSGSLREKNLPSCTEGMQVDISNQNKRSEEVFHAEENMCNLNQEVFLTEENISDLNKEACTQLQVQNVDEKDERQECKESELLKEIEKNITAPSIHKKHISLHDDGKIEELEKLVEADIPIRMKEISNLPCRDENLPKKHGVSHELSEVAPEVGTLPSVEGKCHKQKCRSHKNAKSRKPSKEKIQPRESSEENKNVNDVNKVESEELSRRSTRTKFKDVIYFSDTESDSSDSISHECSSNSSVDDKRKTVVYNQAWKTANDGKNSIKSKKSTFGNFELSTENDDDDMYDFNVSNKGEKRKISKKKSSHASLTFNTQKRSSKEKEEDMSLKFFKSKSLKAEKSKMASKEAATSKCSISKNVEANKIVEIPISEGESKVLDGAKLYENANCSAASSDAEQPVSEKKRVSFATVDSVYKFDKWTVVNRCTKLFNLQLMKDSVLTIDQNDNLECEKAPISVSSSEGVTKKAVKNTLKKTSNSSKTAKGTSTIQHLKPQVQHCDDLGNIQAMKERVDLSIMKSSNEIQTNEYNDNDETEVYSLDLAVQTESMPRDKDGDTSTITVRRRKKDIEVNSSYDISNSLLNAPIAELLSKLKTNEKCKNMETKLPDEQEHKKDSVILNTELKLKEKKMLDSIPQKPSKLKSINSKRSNKKKIAERLKVKEQAKSITLNPKRSKNDKTETTDVENIAPGEECAAVDDLNKLISNKTPALEALKESSTTNGPKMHTTPSSPKSHLGINVKPKESNVGVEANLLIGINVDCKTPHFSDCLEKHQKSQSDKIFGTKDAGTIDTIRRGSDSDRPKRTSKVVSYKEPTLMKKLRREK